MVRSALSSRLLYKEPSFLGLPPVGHIFLDFNGSILKFPSGVRFSHFSHDRDSYAAMPPKQATLGYVKSSQTTLRCVQGTCFSICTETIEIGSNGGWAENSLDKPVGLSRQLSRLRSRSRKNQRMWPVKLNYRHLRRLGICQERLLGRTQEMRTNAMETDICQGPEPERLRQSWSL